MNRKAFFDVCRSFLSSRGKLTQTQVTRIDAVLDVIEARELSPPKAAYILGTAHHESDAWKTLTEYASGAAYEGRKDLGNTQKGDGRKFKGRGLVQITGRRNYADWSKRLGVDLVAHPELAADLKYAVPILVDGMILGTFTGKRLSDYFNKTKSDWLNARRIVNGKDKANLIVGHAKKFLDALEAAA